MPLTYIESFSFDFNLKIPYLPKWNAHPFSKKARPVHKNSLQNQNYVYSSIEPTYTDPRYNDLLVITTAFQCTYDFPMPTYWICVQIKWHFRCDMVNNMAHVKRKNLNRPSKQESSTCSCMALLNHAPVKCCYLKKLDNSELKTVSVVCLLFCFRP